MLVLTRRKGESLQIGDDVCITVLGSKGDQIRLGIEAPRSLPVFRTELVEKARRQKEEKNSD